MQQIYWQKRKNVISIKLHGIDHTSWIKIAFLKITIILVFFCKFAVYLEKNF